MLLQMLDNLVDIRIFCVVFVNLAVFADNGRNGVFFWGKGTVMG